MINDNFEEYVTTFNTLYAETLAKKSTFFTYLMPSDPKLSFILNNWIGQANCKLHPTEESDLVEIEILPAS